MKNCDIHIKTIDPGELGDGGLACSVKLEEADISDKLMLMHTMANILRLNKMDLIMYVKSEIEGIFDEGSTVITVPGGKINEG